MTRFPQKERRTKDAPGTSGKRHTERALADAPSGARLKALLLYQNFAGFPGSSVLTLARQFGLFARPFKGASDRVID